MSATADAVVGMAESYLGTEQGDAIHKKIIDTYNKSKPLARGYKMQYNDPWCAAFVTSVAISCGASDIIPKECGAQEMADLCKVMGIYFTGNTPRKGDLVFYRFNSRRIDHVGIVRIFTGTYMEVIEGNKSRKVATRKIYFNDSMVAGFARPRYREETTSNTPYPTSYKRDRNKVKKN